MKLLSFKASGVHGFLKFDIHFKDDITFLIGINGTGKTSVLKIILGLISPSYTNLNLIEFEEATLIIGKDSQSPMLIINAFKISKNMIKIELMDYANKNVLDFGSLTKVDVEVNSPQSSFEEKNEQIKNYRNEFESQSIYVKLKKITTPLFLGLDRRIYEGYQIDSMSRNIYLRQKRYSSVTTNDPLNRSLIDLQQLIFDYYRIIGAKQNTFNEEFKNNILTQSFDFVEEFGFNLKTNYRELLRLKEKTLEAIETLNVSNLSTKIILFFDKMIEISREVQNEKDQVEVLDHQSKNYEKRIVIMQKWFNNQPQLERIQRIINYSLNFKEQVDHLYEPVYRLKILIDNFFKESGKTLLITPEGELKIQTSRNISQYDGSCYQLSSGEKQILTMIGHLIFFENSFQNESGIFIIDEPELSLHLAWQEIFVEAIKSASPGTQFILATHSPAIIAAYDEMFCEDLAKQN
jgi:predicted ATP-dependent endonuclease of OLD family